MSSIDFNLVPGSAAASATYIEQRPERRNKSASKLPQKIVFPAQFNSGLTPAANVPVQIFSLGDIQTRAGRGSMAAIMYAAIQRWGSAIPCYWIPLADDAAGVVATRTIAVTAASAGAGTRALFIAGRKILVSVTAGMTAAQIATAIAAAVNADLDCAMTATATDDDVTLSARHKGAYGNALTVLLDLDIGDAALAPSGVTLTIATGATGSADPVLTTALGNLGGTSYTILACPYTGDTSLDAMEAAWDVRIGPAVKRPFIGLVGSVDTLANYTTALASRNSPGTTFVPVEGSPNHPMEIAAVAAGLLGIKNDAAPGVPVRGYKLTGIRGNAAYAVWTGAQRDAIVKLGGSWTRLDSSGSVLIGDLVTTYKTNAQDVEDAGDYWRFTSTLSNIQAKIYSIDTLINSAPYLNAVIVDDSSPSGKSYVVRPKTLKADLIGLVDLWIENGWSKNRAEIVAGIVVEINEDNPTRLDAYVPDIIAAGLRQIGTVYGWSLKSAA